MRLAAQMDNSSGPPRLILHNLHHHSKSQSIHQPSIRELENDPQRCRLVCFAQHPRVADYINGRHQSMGVDRPERPLAWQAGIEHALPEQFAEIVTEPGLTWDMSNLYTTGHVTLTSIPGALSSDFNSDGSVDGDDLCGWQEGFGAPISAQSFIGDADGDLDVDGGDFLVWQREFSIGSLASAVPEPASILLLLNFGCLALVRCRMRGLAFVETNCECLIYDQFHVDEGNQTFQPRRQTMADKDLTKCQLSCVAECKESAHKLRLSAGGYSDNLQIERNCVNSGGGRHAADPHRTCSTEAEPERSRRATTLRGSVQLRFIPPAPARPEGTAGIAHGGQRDRALCVLP